MLKTPKTSLIALLLAAPLAATPALAEQHSTDAPATEAQSDTSATETESEAQADSTEQADPLLVTVGGAEINASQVQSALMAFPPQLRQSQPPDRLIRMAIEQLILRELILRDAAKRNMAEDEEVKDLIAEDPQRPEEEAILQVYLEREMDGAVTPEAVQAAYDAVAASSETELPPLDAVRPQVEQQVRQERMNALGAELSQDVEIVFYGPDGQPQVAPPLPSVSSETETKTGPEAESTTEPQTPNADPAAN